jgi:hypothetical protein
MIRKIFFNSLLGLSLAFAGCGKRGASSANANRQSGGANFEACALITGAEIEAVVGSPIKDTKSSGSSSGGMRISQCFYTAAEFNKSVSLAVTQTDPDSDTKRSAKAYWQDSFGRYDNDEKEHAQESESEKEKRESLQHQREKGEEEEGSPPKKIPGIGDEAFWTGNRVGGALYVLKKDTFIRISLGGPDTQEAKIDKSKALAQKVLDRL